MIRSMMASFPCAVRVRGHHFNIRAGSRGLSARKTVVPQRFWSLVLQGQVATHGGGDGQAGTKATSSRSPWFPQHRVPSCRNRIGAPFSSEKSHFDSF